jgi:SNF2 family DNA or RNA helicase
MLSYEKDFAHSDTKSLSADTNPLGLLGKKTLLTARGPSTQDETKEVSDRKYIRFRIIKPPIPSHEIAMLLRDPSKLAEMPLDQLIDLAAYPSTTTLVKREVGVIYPPLKKGIELYTHQKVTINWMRQRETKELGIRGGILKLSMGLGKTLTSQVYALSTTLALPKESKKPILVVCSLTCMSDVWQRELESKFEGLKILYLHASKTSPDEIEELTRSNIKKYDIVVTTYDFLKTVDREYKYHEQGAVWRGTGATKTILRLDCRTPRDTKKTNNGGACVLYETVWTHLILDESQVFANPGTKTYHSIISVVAKYKWCLTGTPVRNYNTDVWAQLRVLGYDGCPQASDWRSKGEAIFQSQELSRFILSMDYKDAGIVLPDRIDHYMYISLNEKHLQVYRMLLGIVKKALQDHKDKTGYMEKLTSGYVCVLELFLRLRQCLISPFLLTPVAKRGKAKYTDKRFDEEEVEEIEGSIAAKYMQEMRDSPLWQWCCDINQSGFSAPKIKELFVLLEKIKAQGAKVVVYSTFRMCLDLIAEKLNVEYGKGRKNKSLPHIRFRQVDGTVVGEERTQILNEFREDKGITTLLASYKVCSEGITLVQATYCVCVDAWWTDAVHQQSKARIWRIGQTKEVNIFTLFAVDTLDERIKDICEGKLAMADRFLDGTYRDGKKKEGGMGVAQMERLLEGL